MSKAPGKSDAKSSGSGAASSSSSGGDHKAPSGWSGPTFHLSDAHSAVPVYRASQFDASAVGGEQTVLRVIVRPVTEHERMTAIKMGVESVLSQTLYHMGVYDVKANRIYHFNDRIGGNAGHGAAEPSASASASAASASASSASASASSSSAAAAKPPAAASASKSKSGSNGSGGVSAALVTDPDPPAGSTNAPHPASVAVGSAPASFLSGLLPAGLQSDKLAARWVATTVSDFQTPAYATHELLFLGVRLPVSQQVRALEHAKQMALAYDSVSGEEVPSYDALYFNCQHMTFKILGAPFDACPGQADLVRSKAVSVGRATGEWVTTNPKTTAAMLGLGAIVGLLYAWAVSGSSSGSSGSGSSASGGSAAGDSKKADDKNAKNKK